MSERIVIGLGGNAGGSAAIVQRFVAVRLSLAYYGSVRAVAPIYRSAPVGPVAQPPFLNSAIEFVAPALQPIEVVTMLQELERMLGRDRASEVRWGPRPIDLDVLVWEQRTIATPALVVPHPRLAERRFALAPLVALVGEAFVIPNAGRAGDLLAAVADQDVEEVAAFRQR